MGALIQNIGEKSIHLKIRSDIGMISDIEELRRDPIGNAIYLSFLLKNKRRGPEIEALILLMNEWISDIIIMGNFSRAVDVEITSAIMAYGTLKRYKKLEKDIKVEKINEILSRYIEKGQYFQSFTLSTFIGNAILDISDKIEVFSDLVNWIKNKIFEEDTLNDAKNIVFSFLFFEGLKENEIVKKIFNYCYDKFKNNNIMFYDELYYTYILWNKRQLIKDINKLKEIRIFVNESILNANKYIKNNLTNQISKIYKSIFIDIENNFKKNTIKVSKEEISLDDLKRMIILAPTFSFFMIFLGTFIGFKARMGKFDYLLKIIFKNSIPNSIIVGFQIFVYIIISLFYLISLSILWDILFKKIVRTEVIKTNIFKRFKNYVVWFISPSIIIAIFDFFFH